MLDVTRHTAADWTADCCLAPPLPVHRLHPRLHPHGACWHHAPYACCHAQPSPPHNQALLKHSGTTTIINVSRCIRACTHHNQTKQGAATSCFPLHHARRQVGYVSATCCHRASTTQAQSRTLLCCPVTGPCTAAASSSPGAAMTAA